MKSPVSHVGCALAVSLLIGALALTGCSGAVSIPDSILPGNATTSNAPIQGSVFGGHAPIVGSHVYVLQAGIGAYAETSLNIMNAGSAGSDTHGAYVLTASDGSFNVSGDYACTPGLPVYLAATGGYTSTAIGGPGYSTAPVTITAASVVHTGGEYVYTFTANNLLFPGQAVTLALTNAVGGKNWTALNGAATVYSATTTSFVVEGASHTISGSATGTATVTNTTPNPAIVNMAVLGNCPTSGVTNFGSSSTDPISYVYMNEVSTVATAYALAGFGTGPFNIGIPSSGSFLELNGIQNAANNANQLYSIEGANTSTTFDGEGHIAREYTPAPVGSTPNGVVPESTLDTLGNILASCVDSVNTANSATNPLIAGSSDNCEVLFENATSNGIPYTDTGHGTVPTDTATAVFNIAHNPAGAPTHSAAFMAAIFALQGSETTPFTPDLNAVPNDFTIGIAYPSSLNADMGNPESIAVDGAGNVFFSNQNTGYISKLLPTGVPSFNYSTGVIPGYLTIDPTGSPNTPTSNNVWFGPITAASSIVELTNAGAFKAQSSATYSTVSAAAANSSGDFYFLSATPAITGYEFTPTFGSAPNSPLSGAFSCMDNADGAGYDTYDHLAVDSSQNLWISGEHAGVVCRMNANGTVMTGFPINLASDTAFPEVIGFDSTGNAWVSVEGSNDVIKIPKTGVTHTTYTTAAFSEPFSASVDGSGNIWVTNRTGASIAELSNAGVAISPAANYQPSIFLGASTTTYPLDDPLNAAIDGSGNIWITNYNGDRVIELIGAASPAVTPLSYASGASGYGVKP